jgi:hypothetical protein
MNGGKLDGPSMIDTLAETSITLSADAPLNGVDPTATPRPCQFCGVMMKNIKPCQSIQNAEICISRARANNDSRLRPS